MRSGRQGSGCWGSGYFTSHVFLSFVDYERISTMLLLFLFGFFILMCIGNNPDLQRDVSVRTKKNSYRETYSLNGSKSTEFALKILLRGIVAQSCNNEGLESIAANIWIFLRFV